MTEDGLGALAEGTRARLKELQRELEASLQQNLVSLVVYGSAARGGYRPGQSDVDVVIVLKDASRPELSAIANAIQLARYSARIEAMVLLENEISHSTDVFPILYEDIARHHVVLFGKDPFKDLAINKKHRRLRIEQELREAEVRLRRAVIDSLGAKEALAGAVIRKAKQIRAPLFALLELKGVSCEDRSQSVLEKAGERYGVDTKPILRARESSEEGHDALVRLLRAAIAEVDAMEDG
jgi:predicted nucleotidyltransferase